MKASSTSFSEKKYRTYYSKKQLQMFSEVAKKHGVDEAKVRQMFLAYGNFIATVMEEGKESVFIPNFGKLISKDDYKKVTGREPKPDKEDDGIIED